MKQLTTFLVTSAICCTLSHPADACTGITLTSRDGSRILARTIEWGGSELNSSCVIIPRGHRLRSLTPDGSPDGIAFTARYGYVGLSVYQEQFIAEGLNEAGLSAGLFYFPGYGEYPSYDAKERSRTLADLQLVSYLLATCATVDDACRTILDEGIRICAIDPRAGTAHWRIADREGRQVVLEFIGGHPLFHDNPLGVITNAPSFDWQLTNLNNYVNLRSGSAPTQTLGQASSQVHATGDILLIKPFGAGSGMLGLPGDVTPPSRFVRAAFFQSTAPVQPTAEKTVLQAFHLLNNFDIPLGIESAPNEPVADIPSATQWTSVTDLRSGILYYRTMYNSSIRRLRLGEIDFSNVRYQVLPLDKEKEERIENVTIEK